MRVPRFSRFSLFTKRTAFLLPLLLSAGFAQAQTKLPLRQFWSDKRQDFWVVATPAGVHAAAQVFGYKPVRIEGYILKDQQPGTVPLELFWNEQRSDNRNVATAASEKQAVVEGYSQKAVEGYVFPAPAPGLVPLKLYFNGRDSFTLATNASEDFAKAHGYRMLSIEGYIYPSE